MQPPLPTLYWVLLDQTPPNTYTVSHVLEWPLSLIPRISIDLETQAPLPTSCLVLDSEIWVGLELVWGPHTTVNKPQLPQLHM